MQADNLQSIIESLIFVSDKPITFKEIKGVFDSSTDGEISEAIEKIKNAYHSNQHGIYLEEVGGGYQFRTKIEKAPWLKKLMKERPTKLTRSQLETLAMVAYKQPVTRVDIDAIRGVDSSHLLKILLDKKLIRILGVKEAPGRPLIYGTTLEFLEFFNLSGLDTLPKLEDLKELKPHMQHDLPLFKQLSLKNELEHKDLMEVTGEDHSSNPNKSSGS